MQHTNSQAKGSEKKLPVLGMLYLDHVLRFFDKSNFRGWPYKIETVVYHWGNDKERFINEVRRKKIDVLIGNIPATAYETFREIALALPHVKFIPSMDTQFSNKSKENVTHFCEKYDLPIPKTHVFYEKEEGRTFLASTSYPKIIKRSYGPSNYGGYFVHKVDSEAEAVTLMDEKKYYPLYIQDFVPMKADIRVMLIGHKPVCAFWRRPPEGEWLTNTSQGGSMDYMDVPKEALDVAVKASKAANAEYWACDIAVSFDDQYSILECATAFAAFPYIRDWIGQYLMWQLSDGRMKRPHIPMLNWEELGKISSSVLRTMRYITFGRESAAQAMTDTGELAPAGHTNKQYAQETTDNHYPMSNTVHCSQEEWPSSVWNRQDNYLKNLEIRERALSALETEQELFELLDSGIEESAIPGSVMMEQMTPDVPGDNTETEPMPKMKSEVVLSEQGMLDLLTSARGVSHHMAKNILETFGVSGVIDALRNDPHVLTKVRNLKERKLAHIRKSWESHLKSC